MEIEASWISDNDYLQKYWRDWILYRSKARKSVVNIGLGLVMLGIVSVILIYVGTSSNLYLLMFGGAGIGGGIGIIIWHFYDKKKWFAIMSNAPSFKEAVTLRFTPNMIYMSGPTSKGEMLWKGIEKMVIADEGTFMILQKRISIYIPKVAVKNEGEYEQIHTMYNEA